MLKRWLGLALLILPFGTLWSQPLVQVVDPVGPLAVSGDGTGSFTFEAFPQGAALDHSLVRVDGVLVLYSELGTTDRVVKSIQLRVPKSAKTITLQVFDKRDRMSQVTLHVSKAPPPTKSAPVVSDRPARVFVLAIGISNYRNSSLDLSFADKDAQSVAQLYRKASGRGPEVHTLQLVNEQATRTAILDARTMFLDQAGPQDLVIVFLAGHGVSIHEQFYFLTWGADPVRPYAEGISADELKTILLSGLKMKQGLVFIDACLSGLATQTGVDTDQRRIRADLVSRLGEGSGLYFLSSSSSSQPSAEEQKWGHGLLTQALLMGLGAGIPADADRDGSVRLVELDAWLRSEIPRLSQGHQTPEGGQLGTWPGRLSLFGWQR